MKKDLYKIEIWLLKMIPMIIAALYLLNTVLSYFHIELLVLSLIGGMSLLPLLFLYISSFVFGFCLYHRMFIYYIAVNDIVSYADYLSGGLPVSDRDYLFIHIIITGIFLFIILYLKKKCSH